jgi:hypothetical protein
MVIQVKVNDRSNYGFLVGGFQLTRVGAGRFVGYIVDMVGFVPLAVGVDHRGTSSSMGEAFFLAMPHLVPIPADNVGLAGVVVTGLTIVASRAAVVFRPESAIPGPKCCDLFDFLFSQLFKDDPTCFFWLRLILDSGNLFQPLMVILNIL